MRNYGREERNLVTNMRLARRFGLCLSRSVGVSSSRLYILSGKAYYREFQLLRDVEDVLDQHLRRERQTALLARSRSDQLAEMVIKADVLLVEMESRLGRGVRSNTRMGADLASFRNELQQMLARQY